MEASTSRIASGFIAALALLALNAAVSYNTLGNLVTANQLVANTEQSLRLLGELRTNLIDAETSQRGYIITGDERHLDPYVNARPVAVARLKDLARLTTDDTESAARLASLEPLLGKRFDQLNDGIVARRERGTSAAMLLVQDGQGKATMDRIRHIVNELQNREEVLLATRNAEAEFNASVTSVTFAVAAFVNVCLLGGICFMVIRGAMLRRKSAAAEQEFNAKLAASLAELRERNQEVTFLSQMSSFLQTCASSEEACTAIARFGTQLFPHEAGMLFMFHASRNYLELAASWGGANANEEMFPPADCWALRRGRLHTAGEHDHGIVCAHVARHGGQTGPYLCAPLMAQGETLGLLYLTAHAAGNATKLREETAQLATAVAEQIALALSNLRLRETLRQQSVRDPLTGLYNRRFLEETLDREIARLERKGLPLSLIMIDVDNFKTFNDTFGHDAGDAVLRDLGGILQRHVRGGDIACRYGGEEFTIVLPEATIEIGRQRAEMLREAVRELRLMHDGKSLGAVTLSLGVACFPDHGRRREHLLQCADAALYEAKHGGRNRVVIGSVKPLKVVESPQQRDQAGR